MTKLYIGKVADLLANNRVVYRSWPRRAYAIAYAVAEKNCLTERYAPIVEVIEIKAQKQERR